MSFLPSVQYPPAGDGYWSPVTSTLNWCEEDYYVTSYSAEIINSVTNLIFVFLAYKGISSCIRYKHDNVYLAGFISYLIIGLGSFCFHTTLKYPMQLVDELSMIYTTCIMFYAIFSHDRSAFGCTILFFATTFIAVFITTYYHYLQDPVFHQNMFALLTAIVVFRSIYAMEMTLRPSRKSRVQSHGRSGSVNTIKENARAGARDLTILRTMWKMIYCGVGSVACGFLIWNLDNIYCSTLRRWRREIGLPWGILLEGHGWWHIFTGIAAYFNLTWAVWLRYCLDGKQDEVELEWLSMLSSVPIVIRKRDLNGGEKSSWME
ncbi:ceramidase [Rhexocercosporidium sp. MPI-PUGE-AT-0058]|nr:ceramidase [Rhexocercosporidium sp. MPI-PUGE-AT-0058]